MFQIILIFFFLYVAFVVMEIFFFNPLCTQPVLCKNLGILVYFQFILNCNVIEWRIHPYNWFPKTRNYLQLHLTNPSFLTKVWKSKHLANSHNFQTVYCWKKKITGDMLWLNLNSKKFKWKNKNPYFCLFFFFKL